MRIALQFAGEPRSFKRDFEVVQKYILEPFNPDVFISTWHPFEGRFPQDGTVEEFIDLWKPVNYEIEKYEDLLPTFSSMAAKITNKRPEIKPMWVLGGQYKIMRCNLLRKFHEVKHGFIYDVVIKYRADLTINKVPPIEKTDCIVQPIGHDSIGQHDIFGWGPTHFMDCWLDLFSHLQWYIEDGVLFHPEYLLKHHLKNVPIKRIPFELWLRGEKVCG